MILYKFKNLEPFAHIVDLLITGRLYCPHPSELNDPLEGVLGMGAPAPSEPLDADARFKHSARYWLAMRGRLEAYRVCCFSSNPKSLLMWSHYGSGHSGICLELDVAAYSEKLFKVEYLNDLSSIADATPEKILRYKASSWAYEEEYRIVLSPNATAKYLKVAIKAVLIGAGVKDDYIRPLFELCRITGHQRDFVSFNTRGEFTRFPLSNAAWDKEEQTGA